MAKRIIAPAKAPTASLMAILALTGTLRMTAVLALQVSGTAMKKEVSDWDNKAQTKLDNLSHNESEEVESRLADPGMSSRKHLRY
jgi:hypothetical protein